MPEENEVLKKILELSEDNNRILHSIQKTMFWQKVSRYVYWAIIISVAVGFFYFLEPYIDQVLQIYGNIKDGAGSIFR